VIEQVGISPEFGTFFNPKDPSTFGYRRYLLCVSAVQILCEKTTI
jgi:hypothetical protein